MSVPWQRNGSNQPASKDNSHVWTEHVANDGRVYYWNSETKTSSWEKPDCLQNASSRTNAAGGSAASLTSGEQAEDWKTYETPEGKTYYHNHATSVTTWEKPDILVAAEQSAKAKKQSSDAKSDANAFEGRDLDEEIKQELERTDRINMVGADGKIISAAMYALSDEAVPSFKTPELAEEAFHKMLRRSGVQADWTWNQCMRACIKEPVWRSLPDTMTRKNAFERFIVDVKKATIGKQKDRIEKLKIDFDKMLSLHDEIKPWSRWENVRGNLEKEVAYKAAIDDEERETLFETYVEKLQARQVTEDKENDVRSIAMSLEIMKSLQIEVSTRWSDAQKLLQKSSSIQSTLETQGIHTYFVLRAFEDHMADIEAEHLESVKREARTKRTQERKNRKAYTALLSDLRSRGEFDANTQWKELFLKIKDTPEYVNMLGQAGSSPLDIFLDNSIELMDELKGKKSMVMEVLDNKHQKVTADTEFSEFWIIMQSDNRTSHMSETNIKLIFDQLRQVVVKKIEEETKAQERKIRRRQDDLRAAMKKLDPPIGVDDTYDAVRVRISMLAEFAALESEESREAAFQKYIRRLKERLEDDERRDRRDRERHHRSDRRDPDRDRDSRRDRERSQRDRERRSSRDSRRSKEDDNRDRDRSRRRHRSDRRPSADHDPRSPKRARHDRSSPPARDTDEQMLDYGGESVTGPGDGTNGGSVPIDKSNGTALVLSEETRQSSTPENSKPSTAAESAVQGSKDTHHASPNSPQHVPAATAPTKKTKNVFGEDSSEEGEITE